MSALVLANGLLQTNFAKTTHGLVRGPSRYPLAGVIDPAHTGADAGTLLDGRPRNLPVFASVPDALTRLPTRPTHCIVGVATVGGVLPPGLYADLIAAAEAGLTLVNGLHHLLSEDETLARLTRAHGSDIIDIRRPPPTKNLRFWSGDILKLTTPRVAVLGTDCAVGKRTTALLLRNALRTRGLRAEMIYTGQTGWLQGLQHGFIFDATPNDFVAGALEGAVLACARDTGADVILLEGQASLRNPSGPTGSEFILSAGARGVILQHDPTRTHFEDMEELGCRIPPLKEEIALIRLLGAEVWAVTLNEKKMTDTEAETIRTHLADDLALPVLRPLQEIDALGELVRKGIGDTGTRRRIPHSPSP